MINECQTRCPYGWMPSDVNGGQQLSPRKEKGEKSHYHHHHRTFFSYFLFVLIYSPIGPNRTQSPIVVSVDYLRPIAPSPLSVIGRAKMGDGQLMKSLGFFFFFSFFLSFIYLFFSDCQRVLCSVAS